MFSPSANWPSGNECRSAQSPRRCDAHHRAYDSSRGDHASGSSHRASRTRLW
uniref:Uncharacterized protein n=1 Tax=Arundo donax TaxID=35708 RepID=A0A0A9GWY2_ARUDO